MRTCFILPNPQPNNHLLVAGCLSAGVTATMAGGNFWEGVCNGLICAGLNHAMHLVVAVGDGAIHMLKDYNTKWKHVLQGDHFMPKHLQLGLCKYAVLSMINYYFYGPGDYGEDYNQHHKDLYNRYNKMKTSSILKLCCTIGNDLGFSVMNFTKNDPTDWIYSLESGEPLALVGGGHMAAIIGIQECSDGDLKLLLSDPDLYNDSKNVYNRVEYWSMLKNGDYSIYSFAKYTNPITR